MKQLMDSDGSVLSEKNIFWADSKKEFRLLESHAELADFSLHTDGRLLGSLYSWIINNNNNNNNNNNKNNELYIDFSVLQVT